MPEEFTIKPLDQIGPFHGPIRICPHCGCYTMFVEEVPPMWTCGECRRTMVEGADG